MNCRAFVAALVLASGLVARAGTAEEDWAVVTGLDAGPSKEARASMEPQRMVGAHLAAQEKALRNFLNSHFADGRAFEARLRLARLLAVRGSIDSDEKLTGEASRMLDALEKTATPEQRAEVAFARLAQAMRRARQPGAQDREALFNRLQKFRAEFPEDRRLAALLTEIATLYDLQPARKEKLLVDAQALAQGDDLKARIEDDLLRVRLVGQPIALTGPALDGRVINVEDFRGRAVLVCFFAAWSTPALEALDALQRVASDFPKGRVQLLGVSLDTKPEALAAVVKAKALSWPIVCDQKGWESPLVRTLGINALPAAWLLDSAGKLRSLNALEGTASQVRQILNER